MKIVLTGSSGFLGSRLKEHFNSSGHLLLCLPSEELKGRWSEEKRERVYSQIASFSPFAIIHTAAISDTVYSQDHEIESYIANVLLAEEMAKISKRCGAKFIFCSSDQVYNASVGSTPNAENFPCNPTNVYGRHKLEAERLVSSACADAVSLRLTWMYDMPKYRAKTHNNFFLGLVKALANNKPCEYSVKDYRGITYVRSVVENIESTLTLPGGVYNFGSENPYNVYETALQFVSYMGMEGRAYELIRPNYNRGERNISIDCKKIKSFGIEFEDTKDGIKKLIQDYGL